MASLKGNRRSGRPVFLVVLLLVIAYFTLYHHSSSAPDDRWGPLAYVRSSYDWAHRKHKNPVTNFQPLPPGSPLPLGRIQHDFARDSGNTARQRQQHNRRVVVKDAFLKSWESYKEFAWGYDELEPQSLKGKDTFSGWGATLVDTLDTLWMMDLQDEFDIAVHAVATIDWDNTTASSCSLFETNIRYLGGLLSAYELSHERVLLDKAIELGYMLYSAFDTPNRMPVNAFDFQRGRAGELTANKREASASVGSLSLEFTRLAQLTGDMKFYDAIDRIKRELVRTQDSTKLPGMWPTFLDIQDGFLTLDSSFTLGALADSLYEYLPKMYALLGGLDDAYRSMYKKAMETAKRSVLFRPMLPDRKHDILFAGTVLTNGHIFDLVPEGQHLSCFAGGLYALGGKLFDIDDHVRIGAQLTRGCAWAYNVMPTGVMPEVFDLIPCRGQALEPCEWNETRWTLEGNQNLPRGFSRVRDPRYLLRPEAIESVFLLYRITGDPEWQDVAWQMFQSIKRATETKFAHSAIFDVTAKGFTEKLDSMESFWLAETLKYFYLIFSEPSLISLDDYVLNTEAHPFRLPKPKDRTLRQKVE
ncbi:alpha-1,2-Mannosidase [Pleurostoma richardsiae]|uniref:alpha-1,2-Mannosidase n=1 Tax=Pleurostoma richardsiae TaxID=41990 RepID=A0AA38RPW3_9PEZI|nr:alpha-1,2-Mannosidase [Pleurostoma richardsiae]